MLIGVIGDVGEVLVAGGLRARGEGYGCSRSSDRGGIVRPPFVEFCRGIRVNCSVLIFSALAAGGCVWASGRDCGW